MSERFNELGKLEPAEASGWGFAAGLALMAGLAIIARTANLDEGRSSEIAVCPVGYKGLVQVTDLNQIRKLARIAGEYKIGDPEASDTRSDLATLPGELTCRQDVGDGKTITVLGSAGLDALQRSGETLHGTLPDGLEWTSTIRH